MSDNHFLLSDGGVRGFLSLTKSLEEGIPVACILEEVHGEVPVSLLHKQGECLGIPVKLLDAEKIESEIEDLKGNGFEEGNTYEGSMSGEEIACCFANKGFKGLITYVDKKKASMKYVGRFLDHSTIDEMVADGIDPSGGDGSFYLLVVDGPVFKKPLAYVPVKIYQDDKIGYIEYEA